MFIGHAFLALALGVPLGRLAGLEDSQIVAFGLVAAGSSILPDLDLLVSIGSIGSVLGDSVVGSWEGYWTASNPLHREVSHTLVGGAGTAIILTMAVHGVRSFFEQRVFPLAGAVAVGIGGLLLPLLVLGPAVDVTGWLGFSFVIMGAVLLGAGFEVYEFVFKRFWYDWTLRYYLIDTVVDLVNNVLGALVAVGGIRLIRR